MKKAEEFLIDTQLGEKKFEIKKEAEREAPSEEEPLKLAISGLTPAAVLETAKREKLWKRVKIKGWYRKLDDAVRALGKPKTRDIALFFRLLAVMLNAGIPLIASLDVISEQTLNKKLKQTIYDIARAIERGGTLSGALLAYPKLFSDSQVGMIRAGEASGQLNRVLQELAIEVEKLSSIAKKIRGALIYPAFILVLLALVVSGMLMFVVPKISEIFTQTGQQLPLLTRLVIGASDKLKANWALILVGVIGVVFLFVYGRNSRLLKRHFDNLFIHLPILGKLLQKYILARFSRSLSNLIRSGIPIIEALQIDSRGLGNEIYRERVVLAGEDLARGIPLAESLKDSPLFPPLLVQMIAVGEQTAQLDTVTSKIAEFYEEEVDITVASFTKILEPVILVLVGLSVGVIVAAIMLPIISLIGTAQNL